jgi:hypothetical protein
MRIFPVLQAAVIGIALVTFFLLWDNAQDLALKTEPDAAHPGNDAQPGVSTDIADDRNAPVHSIHSVLQLLRSVSESQKNGATDEMPRNAFLTYGVGYGANIIQPVANSFQRYTTAQDDIIYFVKASLLEEIRSTLAVMRPENLHLVACPPELEPDEYDVNRWTALTEWASANHHRYKSILVTDARDLIFQVLHHSYCTTRTTHTAPLVLHHSSG